MHVYIYLFQTKDDDLKEASTEKSETDGVLGATTSSCEAAYSSIDDSDEHFSSCCETSKSTSSTSTYSTAESDNGPFPVGEFSTYRQRRSEENLNNLDLSEILNSPIIENHYTDERMARSPTRHCAELTQCNDVLTTVESVNVDAIVVAYNDIVPPLRPNTGETIYSPNRC